MKISMYLPRSSNFLPVYLTSIYYFPPLSVQAKPTSLPLPPPFSCHAQQLRLSKVSSEITAVDSHYCLPSSLSPTAFAI